MMALSPNPTMFARQPVSGWGRIVAPHADLHELTTFPNSKYDDQVDSTSQALDWFKQESVNGRYGLFEYYKQEAEKIRKGELSPRPFQITRGELLRELGHRGFGFGRY